LSNLFQLESVPGTNQYWVMIKLTLLP